MTEPADNATAPRLVPDAGRPAPLVRADKVAVALGGRAVLSDVSLAVRPGEAVALVGPNGAGKTTLLRAVAGLIPASGTLDLDGRPVRDWTARERARRVALVRQQTALAVPFTVREVVALGRSPHLGWTERLRAEDRAAVDDALGATGLAALAERAVTALSGGEQQRVALAQALAQDTPLVLLDEPTAHLDVRHQLDALAQARALADGGRAVVAAVHDLGLAARFFSRLVVLDRGRVVADGPPADVLTPALLHDVFGVEAEVASGPAGVEVRYLGVSRGA